MEPELHAAGALQLCTVVLARDVGLAAPAARTRSRARLALDVGLDAPAPALAAAPDAAPGRGRPAPARFSRDAPERLHFAGCPVLQPGGAGTVEPELRAVRALQLCAVVLEHYVGATAPAAGSRSRSPRSSPRTSRRSRARSPSRAPLALLCLDVSSSGKGASVAA